jgi:hypothetical protein
MNGGRHGARHKPTGGPLRRRRDLFCFYSFFFADVCM